MNDEYIVSYDDNDIFDPLKIDFYYLAWCESGMNCAPEIDLPGMPKEKPPKLLPNGRIPLSIKPIGIEEEEDNFEKRCFRRDLLMIEVLRLEARLRLSESNFENELDYENRFFMDDYIDSYEAIIESQKSPDYYC